MAENAGYVCAASSFLLLINAQIGLLGGNIALRCPGQEDAIKRLNEAVLWVERSIPLFGGAEVCISILGLGDGNIAPSHQLPLRCHVQARHGLMLLSHIISQYHRHVEADCLLQAIL